MNVIVKKSEIIIEDLKKKSIMIYGRAFLLDEVEFEGNYVLLSGEFVQREEIPAFLMEEA